MTREQMFGEHPDGAMSNVPGKTTLFFEKRPWQVNAADCDPEEPCRLYDSRTGRWSVGKWEYDLCTHHTRWWWSAT